MGVDVVGVFSEAQEQTKATGDESNDGVKSLNVESGGRRKKRSTMVKEEKKTKKNVHGNRRRHEELHI